DAIDASQFDGGPSFTLAALVTVNGIATCAINGDPTPVPGAIVKLYTGTTFVSQVTASGTGAFSFSNLGPGGYTLKYVSSGAACGGATLTVHPDGKYDLTPTADSIIRLNNYNWMTAYPLTLTQDPAPAPTKSATVREHNHL